MRQHNGGAILQERGRDILPRHLYAGLGDSQLLPEEQHPSGLPSHQGQAQCSSRPAQQIDETHTNGMAPKTPGFQGAVQEVGRPGPRPVRDQTQQAADSVCEPDSRHPSAINGRSVHGLEQPTLRLRLSPDSHPANGTVKGQRESDQAATSSATLAETVVVPGVAQPGDRLPTQDPGPTGPSHSENGGETVDTSVARHVQLPRLAYKRRSLLEEGFPADIAERIAAPQREGTQRVYDAKWGEFCDWCKRRKIDPVAVTIPIVAEFLNYLFKKQPPLAISTIRGYRSTLSSALPIGEEITNSAKLGALMQSFATERPKKTQFIPQWDFNLVLNYLMDSPFEPIKRCRPEDLTLKTLFLLLLASGRRISEIHALIASDSCIRFARDNSEVRLLTEPGFLAKNQKPGEKSAPIIIPALAPVTGKEAPDRTLCPVRALHAYMKWSMEPDVRKKRRRLFIHFDLEKTKEVDSRQLSRWMLRLVDRAYEWGNRARPEKKIFRTHDVRGISTSWASYNGVDVEEIMRAAFWKSNTTFHSHYLKHLATFSEGTYSLGPLVVAQSVIAPPTSRLEQSRGQGGFTTQTTVPLAPARQPKETEKRKK